MTRHLRLSGLALCLALATGCSDAAVDRPARMTPDGSRAVTQGGAADIAHFRAIVDEGQVPAPDVLDPVGFFAEHAIDLPDADCGQDVCVHESLAVAPRFDGTDWTMAYVAMNTPVDPATVTREDTHVVLVVEQTARINVASSAAMREMLIALRPSDRVTVLGFDAQVRVLADRLQPTDPALGELDLSGASRDAALYDALARAAAIVEEDTLAGRVIVLTSGVANAGLNDADRIENLAGALGQSGVPVSVIGAGADYQASLPARIAEVGGGSLYFAMDGDDLQDVLAIEAQTALTPLATDFELRLEAAPGYRVGRVFGARRAVVEPGAATLSSPVLMIGNRTGSTDVEQGRRGGGGGFFIELIVDETVSDIGPGAAAFTVSASWTAAQSGERQSHTATVDNALAPGEVPSGMWPSFSDPTRGKPFMMINLYFALTLSVELFHSGDCAGALGVEPMLEPAYDGWQQEYSDPDVDADWTLLRAIHSNIEGQCGAIEAVPPVQNRHSVSCMFI